MGSVCLCCQEFIYLFKALSAVIVVSVYDGKRSVDDIACRENCLAGAPWLCAAFREAEALRKIAAFLERVVHFILFGCAVFDVLFEDIFKIVLYDEAYPAESRLIGIIKTEIHYDVALIRDAVELLVSAISAAHARSHDD